MATTKNCRACGSSIPQSATLCSVCKTYQQRWKARLQFYSSSTAFFAAALSLLFWALSQWPTVRILLWPREDVRVIAANSLTGGVVANRGDHEVFVSHVVLFMTGRSKWTAHRFHVDESLAPGKFLRVEAPPNRGFEKGFFVRGVKAAYWEKFVDQAQADSDCFAIVLFADDDPLFRETAAGAGPSLNRLSASGYVEYRTMAASTYSRAPISATAVIQGRATPDCEKKVK